MSAAWTQAAEGFPRRAFTVRDFAAMVDLGILGQRERIELIEGEFVPSPPSREAHEQMKSALVDTVTPRLPEELRLGVASRIHLSEKTFVEPDVCVFRRELAPHNVRGSDLLLVIEVADTSLTFDRGTKALLYASHGARELWVIDVATRVASVHTRPTGVGWTNVREVMPTETLRAAALPNLEIRVADLGKQG